MALVKKTAKEMMAPITSFFRNDPLGMKIRQMLTDLSFIMNESESPCLHY